MAAPTHSQKILQQRGGGIRFIRAEEEGKPCWFYLRLSPEKQAAYEARLIDGQLDIREYGTILESDWGYYPPPDMIRFMKDEHGFDTPLEADSVS